jgi:rSAM/selenodomain-associated transferase 1
VFPTIPPPSDRLLVFARVPELGRVKTRLARELGDDRTLEIYRAMIRDTLQSIGLPTGELEIEVVWAPTPAADGATLRLAFGDSALAMQTGATLGDRMSMAFSERFFFHRTQKIVAIGVDDPLIPRALIDDAFALLESCDWVLGPASDGGYYLIGCRGAAFDVEIFANMEWGSRRVLAETVSRIRGWNHTLAMLPKRSDIDVADDLRTFAARESAGAVAALLREWQWA